MAGFLTPSRPRKAITASSSSSPPRPAPTHASEAYASYGSTYVHLPSASTSQIRHFSFPSATDADIDFDTSVDPEHAVSVSYLKDASVLARQLAGGTVLELRSLAMTTPHATATSSLVLRVTMPAPLLPFFGKAMYVHPVSGDLTLFVVDVNHDLHRLEFEAPNARLRAGHDQMFAFDIDRMSSERIPLDEMGDVVWEALNERSVVLGTPEGTLKARLDHSQWSFTPLRNVRSGGFRFFAGRGSSLPQVSSVAHYYPADTSDPGAYVYSLSADRKLRAWSLVSDESQWTVEDVLDGITGDAKSLVLRGMDDALTSSATPLTSLLGDDSASGQRRSIIKVVCPTDDAHYVVVFVPTPRALDSGGIFRIYKVGEDGEGGVDSHSIGWFTCSSETRGAELIGFEVQVVPGLASLLNNAQGSDRVWRLWTSWNVGGRALTEWSNVSSIFEESQAAPAAPAGETLQNPWRGVSTSWTLEPTYDSAYFDARVVADEYDPGNVFGDIPDVFLDHILRPGAYSERSLEASLDEFAANLTEDAVQELDLSGGRSMRSKISAVIAADISIRGVDLDNEEVVVAARQDLKLKWLGFLSRVQAEDRQSRWPLAQVEMDGGEVAVVTREGLSLLQLQDQVECLAQSGAELGAVPAGMLAAHYAALAEPQARQRYLDLLDASASLAAAYGEDAVADFEACVEEKIADGLRDCTPSDLVTEAYAGVAAEEQPASVELSGLDSLVRLLTDVGLPSLHDYPTFIGLSATLSAWSLGVRLRHVLATRLLLLASARAHQLDLDVIGSLLVAYQYHANWTWLVSLAGGREDAATTGLDVDMQELALGGRSTGETAYSLLHAIAAVAGVEVLAIPPKRSFEASAAEIRLANAMLSSGYPKLAGQYAASLPDGPANLYIYAKAAALTGEIGDAMRAFEHVAASVPSTELNEVLAGIQSLASYYRHVSQLFDGIGSEDAMVHFAEAALQEEPKGSANEEVYARLFRTSLRNQRWSEAFSVMMRNPFVDHSATVGDRPLANLIHAMCANDAVPQLLELPFTGIEHLVESELTFKARNSDPRALPDYHRVLYAWYISKTDFRNAAVVQYQQGRRLGARIPAASEDEYIGLLAQQAQCYLASLQALSLVDSKNAWVITTADNKRRRITSYLPREQARADFVTIDDIRQEYNLLLAQLQVAHRYDGTLDPAAPLTAEDCVGYFCQCGLYDEAFATTASQEVAMEMVFASLAQRCMEIERLSEMQSDLDLGAWLEASPIASSWSGSLAERAWRYLQVSLDRYDTTCRGGQAVVEAIFEMDIKYALPEWLIARQVAQAPEHLVRTLLRHRLVDDAVGVGRRGLMRVERQKVQGGPSCAPYMVLDQILAVAGGGEFRQEVERHMALAA